jgi:uncharacterized membrane protein
MTKRAPKGQILPTESTSSATGIEKEALANRLIWLDVARGVALVAMAIYHFAWDLEFFGYAAAGTTGQGLWKAFARGIASSFLFLAGFSLVLGHHPRIRWKSFGRRLSMIVAAALVISLATYLATPGTFIFFGILHGIAAASLIGLAFLRLPTALIILAALAAVAAPHYLRSPIFDTPLFWWVGLSSHNPPSNDYVPVLPWVGPFLLGMAAARIAKARDWLSMLRVDGTPGALSRLLARGGRHSLLVYLVHQPILIGIVYLASLVVPVPAADPAAGYIANCVSSCEMSQSQAFCTPFCDCTLGALLDSNLFNALAAGEISPAEDPRTNAIVNQCTADVLEGSR